MRWRSRVAAALVLLVAAAVQLFLFVRPLEPFDGPWFLYGRDTVFHDAVVHLWVQQQLAAMPATVAIETTM